MNEAKCCELKLIQTEWCRGRLVCWGFQPDFTFSPQVFFQNSQTIYMEIHLKELQINRLIISNSLGQENQFEVMVKI